MFDWLRQFVRARREGASGRDHLVLGTWGERQAVRHLLRRKYRLVLTNFIAPIGHRGDGRAVTGEVDIIAYDESTMPPTLSFIEVKTRSGDEVATPEAAVDRRKQKQIIRAARLYRRLMRVSEEPYRYDVVSILVRSDEAPQITVWRGYFTEETVRRFYRR